MISYINEAEYNIRDLYISYGKYKILISGVENYFIFIYRGCSKTDISVQSCIKYDVCSSFSTKLISMLLLTYSVKPGKDVLSHLNDILI